MLLFHFCMVLTVEKFFKKRSPFAEVTDSYALYCFFIGPQCMCLYARAEKIYKKRKECSENTIMCHLS
jgi:hypothetical protein